MLCCLARFRTFPTLQALSAGDESLPSRRVTLDDELVRIAQEFTGWRKKTALIREALKALIERESARRLASLEGTMPKLKNIPRRRPETKTN